MSADTPYPAPFDTSNFLFPAEWHTFSDLLGGADTCLLCMREGVITHVNAQLAEQLGYDEQELAGQPVESLVATDVAAGEPMVAGPEGTPVALRAKSGKLLRLVLISNRIDSLHDATSTIWILRPEHAMRTYADEDAPFFEEIVDRLPDCLVLCEEDTCLRYANAAFAELAGESGGRLADLAHAEDRERLLSAVGRAARGDSSVAVAFRLRHRDGGWRHMAASAARLRGTGTDAEVLLSIRDVSGEWDEKHQLATDRKRQLHYLNRLLRLAHRPHDSTGTALKSALKSSAKALGVHYCALWESAGDASAARCIAAYDDIRQNFTPDGLAGPSPESLHAFVHEVLRADDVLAIPDVDRDPRAALHCEYFHAASIKAVIGLAVPRAGMSAAGLMLAVRDRTRDWRKDEIDFVRNVAGLLTQLHGHAERQREQSQLRHLAHHDHLTGLPNRHYLFDQAAEFFPRLAAGASAVAAFFIDLDGFKRINDNHGHAVGDELLKAVALRLKNVVRKEDVLVRLGGDEFMLLARNLDDMRVADDIARQVVESMRGVFTLQGREMEISASVGIAIYPYDGDNIDALMKKADVAMYHAKASGRDRYQLFVPHLKETAQQRSVLESELRHAIEERELLHYYQPQIDLRTGKVRCVEALLRWRHPRLGLLLPASFLPAAESSGLMRRISAWVMNDVCQQLHDWIMQGIGEFTLAINLSDSQLMDRTLLNVLEGALDRAGVPGHLLEWELKESTVMHHHTMSSSVLDRMADLRIGLSIDDFGTGYSNMAYLRRYPVRKVKIDGSFVKGLPGEEEDRAITEAVIQMAKPLGLDVVAEGVETPQQMEYLREHGCDIAQGYFFTEPLTAEQFETWLIRH